MTQTKKELAEANTVEEVKSVLDRHGLTVDDEQAQKILKDIQDERLWRQELSAEEMEHIQGGRDYLHDGCCATVEENSMCLFNDACKTTWVTYTNKVTGYKCPDCGINVAQTNNHLFECPKCHMLYTDRTGTFKRLPGWRKKRPY